MTNEEAKIAMFAEKSVKYIDYEFEKILSLIFTKSGTSFTSSVEVLDSSNCLYRLPVSRIELITEEEKEISKADSILQDKLLELDYKFEYMFKLASAAKYEECSNQLNRIIELLVKFSNGLEDKIKEKLKS